MKIRIKNHDFSIKNYRKEWKKEHNAKPTITFFTNGVKFRSKNEVFDANLVIGYTMFTYTRWLN